MPKYCPECGERIEGNPKFCPECGNELSIEGASAKKTPAGKPKGNRYKTLSTVYLIVGILSILLPLIIFVSMEV